MKTIAIALICGLLTISTSAFAGTHHSGRKHHHSRAIKHASKSKRARRQHAARSHKSGHHAQHATREHKSMSGGRRS